MPKDADSGVLGITQSGVPFGRLYTHTYKQPYLGVSYDSSSVKSQLLSEVGANLVALRINDFDSPRQSSLSILSPMNLAFACTSEIAFLRLELSSERDISIGSNSGRMAD